MTQSERILYDALVRIAQLSGERETVEHAQRALERHHTWNLVVARKDSMNNYQKWND